MNKIAFLLREASIIIRFGNGRLLIDLIQYARRMRHGHTSKILPIRIRYECNNSIAEYLRVKVYEPDILVEDEMDLEPYGLNGKVIHTPRHSIGSVSVVLDNGDTIVGDLIMGRSSPNWPYFADDLAKESIRLITGLSTGSIYCAHTGPFDVKDVKYRFF